MWRPALACLAATLLAGCSGDQRVGSGLGLPGLAPAAVASVAQTDDAAALEAAAEQRLAGRRSLASKVLAAIALERVTGRKPDPARLAELR